MCSTAVRALNYGRVALCCRLSLSIASNPTPRLYWRPCSCCNVGCPSMVGTEREREGDRGFKRSTVARLVGRSVVFVVASLFHVIVLSSPPSSVPSPPFADVQSVDGRADGLLLHLLFHLRMSDPSREERSGEQKSIVRSLLKNVHNSSLFPSAAPCSSFLPLAPRRFFLRSESERASAHGGKWLLSN